MAESKHTPGPWQISQHCETSIENSTGRCIATTGGYSSNVDSHKIYLANLANARLIAAAPDTKRERDELLAAAEKAMVATSFIQIGLILGPAIAKAKGTV